MAVRFHGAHPNYDVYQFVVGCIIMLHVCFIALDRLLSSIIMIVASIIHKLNELFIRFSLGP